MKPKLSPIDLDELLKKNIKLVEQSPKLATTWFILRDEVHQIMY